MRVEWQYRWSSFNHYATGIRGVVEIETVGTARTRATDIAELCREVEYTEVWGTPRRAYDASMDPTERQIAFGKVDFWPKVVERHGLFLLKATNLEAAVASVVDPAYPKVDRNQHLLVILLQLAAIGMNEILTLVGNGLGYGAMKIVRGMVENSINAEYIRLFPEEGSKYREWHWVEIHKQVNQLRNESPGVLDEIPPEKLKADEAEYQRVKLLFRYKVPNGDGTERTVRQDGWCRDNLFERAKKTGTTQIYRRVLPSANQILHGTIGGWFMELDDVNLRLEYPPTERWSGEALIAAHAALIQAIESAAKALEVTPSPTIAELEEDFRSVWTKT